MLGVEQVAADVHVHDAVVVGERGFDEPRGHPDPGVVDQHIQATQMAHRFAHRGGGRGRVGGIGRDEPGPRSQVLHGTLTEADIAPGDHHPRALSQEPPGYGQAKAGGTAGDQRTLALQHTHGRSV